MKTNRTRSNFLRAAVLGAALACAYAPMQASAWPWGSEQVIGNGNVRQQARQVEHFTGLSMELPGQLELRMGNNENITIETDDNLEPLIETVVDNGVLRIRPSKRRLNLRTQNLKIVVNARQIELLTLGGSGSINADKLHSPRLKLVLGGSGKMNVQEIRSESLSVSVGGSGTMTGASGRADKVAISIGGSGNVDLGKVTALNTTVSIGGSGNVKVWPKDALSVSIGGSGNVSYYGDPKVSKSVAGSGSIRRVGSEP